MVINKNQIITSIIGRCQVGRASRVSHNAFKRFYEVAFELNFSGEFKFELKQSLDTVWSFTTYSSVSQTISHGLLIENFMSTHSHCTSCTFIFHKKSGFVMVVLKTIFNSTYRPNLSLFWAGNSNLLYSIFFSFFATLVKSTAFYTLLLLFHSYLNCNFCIKSQFKHFNSLEKQQQCVKSR